MKETVKVCQINGASLLIAPWVRIILFPLQMNVTAVLKKQKKKLFWTRTDPFCTFKIISTNPALLSPCQSKRKHKDGHHRWTATVTKHKNVPIQRQTTLKATKGNAERCLQWDSTASLLIFVISRCDHGGFWYLYGSDTWQKHWIGYLWKKN